MTNSLRGSPPRWGRRGSRKWPVTSYLQSGSRQPWMLKLKHSLLFMQFRISWRVYLLTLINLFYLYRLLLGDPELIKWKLIKAGIFQLPLLIEKVDKDSCPCALVCVLHPLYSATRRTSCGSALQQLTRKSLNAHFACLLFVCFYIDYWTLLFYFLDL